LGQALCLLAAREIPSPYRYDDDGALRVVADHSTLTGIIDASFHQVRQASRGNVAVTLRLLETIADIASQTRDPDFLAALRHHADLIQRGGHEGIPEPWDRKEVDDRYRHVLRLTDAAALA